MCRPCNNSIGIWQTTKSTWLSPFVTYNSTKHIYIDIFFEYTCMQVIWLWSIVIILFLWDIYYDVIVIICYILDVFMYWKVLLMSFHEYVEYMTGWWCRWYQRFSWTPNWVREWITFCLSISFYTHVIYDGLQYDLCIWIIDTFFVSWCKLVDAC